MSTRKTCRDRVYAVVERELAARRDDLTGDATLDELGADSLDAVEVELAIEDELDVEFGRDEALATTETTLDELVARTERRVG